MSTRNAATRSPRSGLALVAGIWGFALVPACLPDPPPDTVDDTGTSQDTSAMSDLDAVGAGADTGDAPSGAETVTNDAIQPLDFEQVKETQTTGCGNGVCETPGENVNNCKVDCCVCGDCKCNGAACGEDQNTCPTDCGSCGNETCDPGESPTCCAADCCGTCGDGKCRCQENPTDCPTDCLWACGNHVCEKGENPLNCNEDCATKTCGNQLCEPPETHDTCPGDCSAACGNQVCEPSEDYLTCPVDCGYCGDHVCSVVVKESAVTCPLDCSATGG